MDITRIPQQVLSDLVREAEYTAQEIETWTAEEVFDIWLQWHGIIGYSSMIWEAAAGLMAADEESGP